MLPKKLTIRGIQGDSWHAMGFGWWSPDPDGTLYVDRTGNVVEAPDGTDEEDLLSAVPIASARMQFRAKASDAEALVELSEGDGIDEDELADGRVMPELTTEQTNLLAAGVWDVEATSDGGEVKTLARGNYIFSEDVTR